MPSSIWYCSFWRICQQTVDTFKNCLEFSHLTTNKTTSLKRKKNLDQLLTNLPKYKPRISINRKSITPLNTCFFLQTLSRILMNTWNDGNSGRGKKRKTGERDDQPSSYAWTVLYRLVQRRDSCGERPAFIMYLPPQKHPGERVCAYVTPVPLNLHVFQKSTSSNINTTDKDMLRVLKLVIK